MSLSDEKTKRFAANSLFPSFIYATVALMLAQLWALQMHGSWRVHLILGIPGLALPGLALFRVRLHWVADGAQMRTSPKSDYVWYVLLFGGGAVSGALISSGSVMLLGVIAALSYLVPWTRIPVCRARFLVSALVTLAPAFGWVALYGRPVHPLHYVIAAWVLLIAPMLAQFLVIASLDRSYRIPEHRPGEKPSGDVPVPLPH